MNYELIKRLNSSMKKVNECWIWTGSRTNKGYGKIKIRGKTMSVHKASWIAHYGSIPRKIKVLHSCDTPLCFRPLHLFLGTQLDNIRDMINKRRSCWQQPGISGESKCASNARLTFDEVNQIRNKYATGSVTQAKLALRFNIHQSSISRIIRGKRWFEQGEEHYHGHSD